jgi:hypothetical protein
MITIIILTTAAAAGLVPTYTQMKITGEQESKLEMKVDPK